MIVALLGQIEMIFPQTSFTKLFEVACSPINKINLETMPALFLMIGVDLIPPFDTILDDLNTKLPFLSRFKVSLGISLVYDCLPYQAHNEDRDLNYLA